MTDYVLLLTKNLANEITEDIGTTWVRPLDARMNLDNQLNDCYELLADADKWYKRPQVGFVIRRGSVTGPVKYIYIREDFKKLPLDID